ncbi:MAG: MEKHLA domain-containing protein [Candidatus Thiothrix moscowensis]|nr:MEKHLA domain-containing protein [Candidatus Thiothrix moscowensis]
MMDIAQLTAHLHLLYRNFRHYVGRDLGGLVWEGESTARVLDDAPFVLLSHNTAADPVFTYGNRAALQLFALDWATLTHLPSRYSAEPLAREERAHLLQTVSRQGYIDNYAGVRIASNGQRFLIQNAIVWNLRDIQGNHTGQAAFFDQWHYI